jgi:hypothetical protein
MWGLVKAMKYIRVILIVLVFFYPSLVTPQSTDMFKTVVEVNDDIITNYELNQRKVLLQTMGVKNISKKDVIHSLINERLITANARQLNVLPTKAEINNAVSNFVKKANINIEDLLKILKSRDISETTFRDYIKSGLTERKVIKEKFVNNIIVSKSDLEKEIDVLNTLPDVNSSKIKFIKVSTVKNMHDDKIFSILNTIRINVDNCLDLQSEAIQNKYIDFQIFDAPKNSISKTTTKELDNLDVYESKIVINSDEPGYLLMLCARNSSIEESVLRKLQNSIFNKRINKIGNSYIQELRGEAFINIK